MLLDYIRSYFHFRSVSSSECATRYPVLLLSSFGVQDDFTISGWGKVPQYLRRGGARVYTGGFAAFASIQSNASLLGDHVDQILDECNSKKINIIAHGKSGLEARYAISKLGLASKVRSLTTISTPHHGTAIADIISDLIKNDSAHEITRTMAVFLGESVPNTKLTFQQLTRPALRKFNREVSDVDMVDYRSFTACMKTTLDDPLFALTFTTLNVLEDSNDGIVSISSSFWGRCGGIINGLKKGRGFSHAQITGSVGIIIAGLDLGLWYVSFVTDLKHDGF